MPFYGPAKLKQSVHGAVLDLPQLARLHFLLDPTVTLSRNSGAEDADDTQPRESDGHGNSVVLRQDRVIATRYPVNESRFGYPRYGVRGEMSFSPDAPEQVDDIRRAYVSLLAKALEATGMLHRAGAPLDRVDDIVLADGRAMAAMMTREVPIDGWALFEEHLETWGRSQPARWDGTVPESLLSVLDAAQAATAGPDIRTCSSYWLAAKRYADDPGSADARRRAVHHFLTAHFPYFGDPGMGRWSLSMAVLEAAAGKACEHAAACRDAFNQVVAALDALSVPGSRFDEDQEFLADSARVWKGGDPHSIQYLFKRVYSSRNLEASTALVWTELAAAGGEGRDSQQVGLLLARAAEHFLSVGAGGLGIVPMTNAEFSEALAALGKHPALVEVLARGQDSNLPAGKWLGSSVMTVGTELSNCLVPGHVPEGHDPKNLAWGAVAAINSVRKANTGFHPHSLYGAAIAEKSLASVFRGEDVRIALENGEFEPVNRAGKTGDRARFAMLAAALPTAIRERSRFAGPDSDSADAAIAATAAASREIVGEVGDHGDLRLAVRATKQFLANVGQVPAWFRRASVIELSNELKGFKAGLEAQAVIALSSGKVDAFVSDAAAMVEFMSMVSVELDCLDNKSRAERMRNAAASVQAIAENIRVERPVFTIVDEGHAGRWYYILDGDPSRRGPEQSREDAEEQAREDILREAGEAAAHVAEARTQLAKAEGLLALAENRVLRLGPEAGKILDGGAPQGP